MYDSFLRLLALGVLFAVAAPTSAGDPLTVALIRAQVKSIESRQDGRVQTAELEVVHVYSGPAEWKGRTFTDVYREEDIRGKAARQPFVVKDEGLWVLESTKKGELHLMEYPRVFLYRRSQKGNPRHAERVKMAEAVEAVGKTKPNEQVKMLVGLLADPTPEVGMWAARALDKSDDPAAGKFLDGFAEKPDVKLPLPTQVQLDEVLSERDLKSWSLSKPRAELLRGWVTGKADEDHAGRVLSRIGAAYERDEIRHDQAVEVAGTAALNDVWPWKVRRRAISLVGKIGERAPERDAAFDWLFAQVKTSKDSQVRQEAALAIRQFILLTAKRRKVVEDHLAGEKDSTVHDFLHTAVKKAEYDDDVPKAKQPEKK